MHKVIISAPGKLHLSGEHAVVYGKPAVLVATSKRVFITLTTSRNPGITAVTPIPEDFLQRVIEVVGKKWQQKLEHISLSINSAIPIGAGMGSSGATSVAIAAAFQQFLGLPWNASEINEVAYEMEKLHHKNPSGGDNTVASFGGLLWYRKEFEFLKTFWLLPFKIPKSFKHFFLFSTPRLETTGDLIKYVGRLDESKREAILAGIEKTTKKLVSAIHDEQFADFKIAIAENQRLLKDLGIVSESVQKLTAEIENSGGVAKISGAGGIKKGSGIILVLHDDPKVVQGIAKSARFTCEQITLGGEGVKIEQVIV